MTSTGSITLHGNVPVLPLLLFLSALFAANFPYKEALPNQQYQFPRDHFEHEDYRTEWWYYTGNVEDAKGKRYGFELVFFRQGARNDQKPTQSLWQLNDLYLAHAAVTEIDAGQFHYSERLNRAGPGIAGADFTKHRIWNGNWRSQWTGENQHLTAITENFRFNLDLTPAKPFILHGQNGISQKAEGAGKASHYLSFPRLNVTGTLNNASVHGQAWMDHEWFTEQLSDSQSGWDWFSAQFDDGTELMLFDLRRKDKTPDPYSAGTWIDKSGLPHHLAQKDFSLTPTAYWTSEKTRARYPTTWRIEIPSLHIDTICQAALNGQELALKKEATTYWEGAVSYAGTHKGRGYLEMTGYDKPVRF